MRVTADDPRYYDWPSRKPSKKTRDRNKLAEKPLEYLAEESTKHAVKKARTVARKLPEKVAGSAGLASAGRAALGTVAAVAAPAALAAAAIGVSLAISKKLYDLSGIQKSAGDRVNQISLEFVAGQKKLQQMYGVSKWMDVPEKPRQQLYSAYVGALARATQGVVSVGRAVGSYK